LLKYTRPVAGTTIYHMHTMDDETDGIVEPEDPEEDDYSDLDEE